MKQANLDQLIDDIQNINSNKNVLIPYQLHEFIRAIQDSMGLERFELFLRKYRNERFGE